MRSDSSGLRGAEHGRDEARLVRLARAGVLRRGTGSLGWVLDEPPVRTKGAQLLKALEEDREDRG